MRGLAVKIAVFAGTGLAAGLWTRHGAEIGIPAGCFGAAAAYLAVIAICGAIEKARKKMSRTEG